MRTADGPGPADRSYPGAAQPARPYTPADKAAAERAFAALHSELSAHLAGDPSGASVQRAGAPRRADVFHPADRSHPGAAELARPCTPADKVAAERAFAALRGELSAHRAGPPSGGAAQSGRQVDRGAAPHETTRDDTTEEP